MKNTEVELRGPIKAGERERIEKFLKEKGATEVSYYDLGIFFNADEIKTFGLFEAASARLQANHKKYPDGHIEQVVKLKVGTAIGTEREEHEMHFKGDGLKTFFEIVQRFGITKACFRRSDRHDWTLGHLTMTLKFGHPIGDHFEAEITNGSREELETFLTNLQLTPWTEEQFKAVVMDPKIGNKYVPIQAGLEENKTLFS